MDSGKRQRGVHAWLRAAFEQEKGIFVLACVFIGLTLVAFAGGWLLKWLGIDSPDPRIKFFPDWIGPFGDWMIIFQIGFWLTFLKWIQMLQARRRRKSSGPPAE